MPTSVAARRQPDLAAFLASAKAGVTSPTLAAIALGRIVRRPDLSRPLYRLWVLWTGT